MASFWKGEEGDASHSYSFLSISNSSCSPHHPVCCLHCSTVSKRASRAGSFCLECPSLPSPLPLFCPSRHLSTWQASPPQGSLLPFRAGASLEEAGAQPMFINGARGSSITLTGKLRVHTGSGRSLCTAESQQNRIVHLPLPALLHYANTYLDFKA